MDKKKYILILAILILLIGGGIFAWQYFWMPREKIKISEEKEINILSPIKGETWIVGDTYQIQWTPSDSTQRVGIMLRDTKTPTASLSKVWQVENIPDTGSYSFTVPEVSSGDYYQIYISGKERYGYSELFSIISKDETADRQIYKNEEYGFEIKYPSTVSVKDWASETPNMLLLVNFGKNSNISDHTVSISIEKGTSILDLKTEVGREKLFNNLIINPADIKDVNIGIVNYPAKKIDYQNKNLGLNFVEYLFDHSGLLYQIEYDRKTDNIITENNFNQMLSTFIFEIDKISNWQTYRDDKYGFEVKYPDTKDVLLIAQGDGTREFLFGGVSCGYSEEESNVLGSVKFFPVIEGGFTNIEYGRNYTKTECDELVERWILHGRFCANRNLTEYKAWCEEGSETSDYHRYDIFLACDWAGKNGRIQCNQLFNQILSTFKFIK